MGSRRFQDESLPKNYDESIRYTLDINQEDSYYLGYEMVNQQLNYEDHRIDFNGNFDLLSAGDIFYGYDLRFSFRHDDNNWANHSTFYAGENNGRHFVLHSTSVNGWVLEPVNRITDSWGYKLRAHGHRLY